MDYNIDYRTYHELETNAFKILDKLPQSLCYHIKEHSEDVLGVVGILCNLEKISELDTLLVKTAAAFHDTGFIEQYQKNEPIGAEIANKELLKIKKCSPEEREIVHNIIMATQMPQNPKTKLEEIMCDADLDNFGREDFFLKGELIRLELANQGIIIPLRQWYKQSLKLLEEHNYFTKSARDLRQAGKERNIKELKELLSAA